MKPNEKIEKEVLKIYDTWLHSYLHGDVKVYDSFLDDDYHFIGSAKNEEFLNRKDTTKFFADTGDQFAGKTEIRNETMSIEQFGELIFITHLLDGWFLNENDWNYYARFRFTSVLKNTKTGWRFIYQHFSIPDPKTEEGETIGYDKINDENQQLREAITRRTFELEAKNRELEIEGALERIRAQATAMTVSSDLLDIVVTMRNEFIKLGHEAHYFWHMMWLQNTYEKAMTSGDGSRIGFVMELPRHIHGDIPKLAKWEKSQKPTVVYTMNIEEAIAYVDKMIDLGNFQNIDPQAPSHDDIRAIGGLTFIMARTSHGEIGYSLPGVVGNPPQEDLAILVQFAGAFDLAHRRFLDLQKAEEQAREVEIELALERVRSRTMAMQHSDELQEASFLLDEQVRGLGIKTWGCAFHIYGEKESTEWFGNEKGELNTYTVPRIGVFKDYYDKGQNGETLFIRKFEGEECVAHYEFMSTLPGIGDVLKQLKKTNKGFPTFQIDHVVYFKYGYLLFITREAVPEAYDIFKRFAHVFEQTYTRFLDLQKVEEQAREAQIEAALERVRSTSMAMHKSSDLKNVITAVFGQMEILEISTDSAQIIIHEEDSKDLNLWAYSPGEDFSELINIPYRKNPVFDDYWNNLNRGPSSMNYTKVQKDEFFQNVFMSEQLRHMSEERKKMVFDAAGMNRAFVAIDKVGISIHNYRDIFYSKEVGNIIVRLLDVFNQAYTRFLDIQKAEAQAREAKIEAALERVRSRSMAMHNSSELSEVVDTLQNEFANLDFNLTFCIINLIDEEDKSNTVWAANPETGKKPESYYMKFEDYPFHQAMWDAWKAQKKRFVYVIEGEEKKIYDKYLYTKTEFSRFPEHIQKANTDLERYVTGFTFFKHSGLQTVSENDINDEDLAILERFGRVFEQAYTRFLDLEKAEQQARDAQINLAVERVRAKALAMHKSEEIMGVVAKLKEEVMGLDIPGVVASTIFLEAGNGHIRMWDLSSLEQSHKDYQAISDITFQLKKEDPHLYIKRVWENPEDYFVEVQDEKDLDRIIEFMYENNQEEIAREVEDYTRTTNLKELYHASKCLNNGKLCIDLLEPPPGEMEGILNKVGAAFDLAYKRFEDLQKAERQTREAQIEAALERVRAKAMSMQSSDELNEMLSVLCQQFDILGILPMSTNLTVFDFENNSFTFRETGKFGNRSFGEQTVELDAMDNWKETVEKWKADKATAINKLHYPKEQLPEVWQVFHESFASMPEGSRITPEDYPDGIYHTAGKHPFGYIGMNQIRPATREEEEIVIKFASEFGRAYQRFLDLQKAEAQTREAQIETALEKVRSRTMAMQKSEELPEAANTLFLEVQALGIPAWSAGYNILSEDKTHSNCIMSSQGEIQSPFTLPLTEHSSLKPWYEALVNEEDFFVHGQKGQDLIEHYNYMTSLPELQGLIKQFEDAGIELPKQQYNHLVRFSKGFLLFITYEEVPESHAIFKRFGKVFEQTYTRFLDLQNAEAREKEAIKQAALDRVRGEIASMRTTKDLERITPLIWKELTTLGVPFFRCGVFIISEDEEMVHAYLSKPDGTSIAALHIPFSDGDNKLIKPTIENWRVQQVYKETWSQDQFVQQTHMFLKKGQIENPEAYDVSETPPEQLVLHLIPFKQGMVYVGNRENLTEDEISLVESLSSAFSVAYSRYEDFKALETAKNSLELTINDLKSAQAQLIQAEKMASLGELTAGIAHEIQNPLNFVNNFSEVSEELVDEMNEELDNGDFEEAKAISKDLKDNLSKINHHGKRADAIVKGMLEHSRINKGEKKPTDINALLDEFVRLSYHGLRAKDKSFNADFKLKLDPNVPKVNVVSSDIGRVILNLVNNAFYACAERGRITLDRGIKTYNPEVIVCSKQTEQGIELSVKDNGGGIPDKVKDKIFQPFFTTKPTGKGTGLGLSLSYDIIKAHGGKLTLESSEGDGTLFSIQIPIQ
ncbi:ATP-binding protein [Winogradskyella aurantia]|uniref:histidine kinase n=1 Tax=Winogradskyella aurantia TaxID=1915063 RepID=A0A265UVD9_9FLAO|nr:ATP-binding protein [Winogradskyella aurantia]OZV69037.1 hypothetical protein CA834_06125 [Winogradskyella aurantia]